MCAAVLFTGKTTPPAETGFGEIVCNANLKRGATSAVSLPVGSGSVANTARDPQTQKTSTATVTFHFLERTFFPLAGWEDGMSDIRRARLRSNYSREKT